MYNPLKSTMMYLMKKNGFYGLLLVSVLATGCSAFKSEADKREARKRALLEKPWFQKLIKKAEEDLKKTLISAGYGEDELDVQRGVKLELERVIKFSNERSMRVDTMYEINTREHIEALLRRETLRRKGHSILSSIDRQALRAYVSTLHEMACIMAKAHNNEHIFTLQYE